MKLKGVVAFLAFLSVCCLGLGINFTADKEPIPNGIIESLTGNLTDQGKNLVEAQDLALND